MRSPALILGFMSSFGMALMPKTTPKRTYSMRIMAARRRKKLLISRICRLRFFRAFFAASASSPAGISFGLMSSAPGPEAFPSGSLASCFNVFSSIAGSLTHASLALQLEKQHCCPRQCDAHADDIR